MPSITVHIDASEVLDELDTEDLVKELLTRREWRIELETQLSKKTLSQTDDPINEIAFDAKEICDQLRYGKPVTESLRAFADRHFGIIL